MLDKKKALQHILKINKSLHTYWMTIEDVLTKKENSLFLQDEMKLAEIIFKNLIGAKDEEDELLCHDPIYNVTSTYYYREATLEDTTLKSLNLEKQLKKLDYHQPVNKKNLIDKTIKLYYSLDNINQLLSSVFNVQCTSLNNELIEIDALIKTILDIEINNDMYHDLFIKLVEDQMLYYEIDELKQNLISVNKALY